MMPFDDYFSSKPDAAAQKKAQSVARAKALQAKARIGHVLSLGRHPINSDSKLGKKLVQRVINHAAESPEDFQNRCYKKQIMAAKNSGLGVIPTNRPLGGKDHCGFLPAKKCWLSRKNATYNPKTKKYDYPP